MKKVVLASLLAVAGAMSPAANAFAQTAVSLGQAAPAGQIQMSADEYAAYNNATTQTAPAAKAAAFETYLTAYPKSAVKADALQQLMYAYSQVPDPAKTLDAADRLLAVDKNNFFAYVFEVSLNRDAGDKATDPAAKQAAYDKAASFATQGLAATKPTATAAADWDKLKAQGYPIFYSAIGTAALNKKDTATAITAFMGELKSVPVAQTTAPGLQLQDTYYLAQAYYTSTPPDYLGCAFYGARAMNFAPEPYKSQFKALAAYCYRKFHGADDGFDTAVTAVAAANLVPPATYASSITPAPKPIDAVKTLVDTTPDLATLALSDKEYALQYGAVINPKSGADATTQKTYADQVFDTIKGKSVEIPNAVIIAATESQLQVAVSDDAVQGKVADFTFNMTAPLKTIPTVGEKITLDGTYTSYTSSPLMITMSDGAVVEAKKAPVKKTTAPVHHTTTKH